MPNPGFLTEYKSRDIVPLSKNGKCSPVSLNQTKTQHFKGEKSKYCNCKNESFIVAKRICMPRFDSLQKGAYVGEADFSHLPYLVRVSVSTLLENFLWISLHVTYDAIAKLYVQ